MISRQNGQSARHLHGRAARCPQPAPPSAAPDEPLRRGTLQLPRLDGIRAARLRRGPVRRILAAAPDLESVEI